jgi:hypothetical protein
MVAFLSMDSISINDPSPFHDIDVELHVVDEVNLTNLIDDHEDPYRFDQNLLQRGPWVVLA